MLSPPIEKGQIMIFRTKIPHRVVLKDGTIKTYQPGYQVTAKDKELFEALQYNRMYRRDIYMNKLAGSFEDTGQEQKSEPVKEVEQEPKDEQDE